MKYLTIFRAVDCPFEKKIVDLDNCSSCFYEAGIEDDIAQYCTHEWKEAV